ncbi:transporter substrate-binding domain-containing protein [Frondihabitans sucicola]|uniref:transporter substrate-binding domain-containing protein n=1 Tax=Frondihabitans sucicola TaxID=1268041 RepID=UPI0033065FF9
MRRSRRDRQRRHHRVEVGDDVGHRRQGRQRLRHRDHHQRPAGREDPRRAARLRQEERHAHHRRRQPARRLPPLSFLGTDQETQTGTEPDLGRLVAAVLGLTPNVKAATWDNLFVGIDTGAIDVGLSNITDTEQRKEKYDFASYREDNLAFAVEKKSTWEFDGDYKNLAGLTIAVSAGTNQEKLVLEWQKKLEASGKKLSLKYYPDTNSTYLALASGKIDAYFGPNPGVAYQNTQTAKSANPTRTAGTFSGAGESLQGLIAATTKKGNGLDKPLADSINYLIEHGQYAKWLKAYNLSNEAVKKSEINPPGLPITNE